MEKKRKWFFRFTDVPGVNYRRTVNVDTSKLLGYNMTPTIRIFEFEGKSTESIMWKEGKSETSASPASRWYTPDPSKGRNVIEIQKLLAEALELPGEILDYHFILQNSHEELWKMRKGFPNVIVEVERLCWLDIGLCESHPDEMRITEDAVQSIHILAYERLFRLYEREGYLREAMQVAQRAHQFSAGYRFHEELLPRLEALEAEGEAAL